MLTIISVSFKSRALLETNYNLVKALNPNSLFHWIVVQNSPKEELESDLKMDDPRFIMVPGVDLSENEKENIYLHSIHHAKALNLALSYTDSDFLLILDPDCFIFMPNWIELVSAHVKKEKIVFFGVPYPPLYSRHYRNFPTAICMFINGSLRLDFMPDAEHRRYQRSYFLALEHHCTYKRLITFFFKSKRKAPLKLIDFPLLLSEFFRKRIVTCSSPDVGYKIYKHYRHLKQETLGIIKKENSLSLPLFKEFLEFGYFFHWKQQMFAFHIQSSRYLEEKRGDVQTEILHKINRFIKTYEYDKIAPSA